MGTTNDDNIKRSSFDIIYDKINDVLGGNNPNQWLLLTIPGQVLNAEDFTYDCDNHAPKSPVVEQNESNLVNKLFDPCTVTGADNGMTLPYQYRSALDVLSPKLNANIASMKNELRKLLLTEYPYDFGDETPKTYTLQEVFFRLYDEYIDAAEQWARLQNETKERLGKQYPSDNVAYNNAWLEWYETFAESHLADVNEKMSKILSVFSPNDMAILEGVLDSGSGAELEQARQTLNNTQKRTPDGGYVYPVKLNPSNWFKLLDTSFTAMDLLESPAALASNLQILSNRRITLNSQIKGISDTITSDDKLNADKTAVENAQQNLDGAAQKLTAAYGEGLKAVFSAALEIAAVIKPDNPAFKGALSKLVNGSGVSENEATSVLDALTQAIGTGLDVQTKLIEASQKLADDIRTYISDKNLNNMKALITPLTTELEKVNANIADVQARMQLASSVANAAQGNQVMPSKVPAGYTQVIIQTSADSMDTQTTQSATASTSTWGVSFWFGGYSQSKSSSSSSFKTFTNSSGAAVEIGMNIAKVGIERTWFNPGVFVLTKDMFNVSKTSISPSTTYSEMSDARLKDMATNGYIFPCYPVAMVIARDISIKVTLTKNEDSSFAEASEAHASKGGGFLIFSGSSSSSSSNSNTGAHTQSTSSTVTIKFDTPQIIGYYMEATPADKSIPLNDNNTSSGFQSIKDFVTAYKKILDDMHKNNIQSSGQSNAGNFTRQ